ncbi:hypothetical protein KIS4809_5626 [Bacillus sp. ZZV12-4809]|nr:hypothetical protein KIS4809_5626 [Bacillus sp. ZZV12-4809]
MLFGVFCKGTFLSATLVAGCFLLNAKEVWEKKLYNKSIYMTRSKEDPGVGEKKTI